MFHLHLPHRRPAGRVMFFWVCGKDYVLEQVNLSRSKPLGRWFYPMAKYLFCGVTLLVLILGAAKGGIG